MSNLTTAAFMLIQAHMCLEKVVGQLNNDQRQLQWGVRLYGASTIIYKIFNEIMSYVEEKEGMDKQINKVKSDIKSSNKKKAIKDVNKLLKMDKKIDKKIDKCAQMSKKKASKGGR